MKTKLHAIAGLGLVLASGMALAQATPSLPTPPNLPIPLPQLPQLPGAEEAGVPPKVGAALMSEGDWGRLDLDGDGTLNQDEQSLTVRGHGRLEQTNAGSEPSVTEREISITLSPEGIRTEPPLPGLPGNDEGDDG